jgi:hypothetical protein
MTDKEIELLLFNDDEPQPDPERAGTHAGFVLSSNWTIGPLLARGCLLPPAWGEESGLSFLDEGWPETLPSSIDALPEDWCDAVRAARRNAFPIGVKLWDSAEGPHSCLALDEVDCLVFENDEEQSMMLDSPFADFDLRKLGLRCEVDPSVFKGQQVPVARTEVRVTTSKEGLRTADCLASLRAILPIIASGTEEWISSTLSLWSWPYASAEEGLDWIADCVKGVIGPKVDNREHPLERRLLMAFAGLMRTDYELATGWPAAEILRRVMDQVNEAPVESSEKEVLSKWGEVSHTAIRGDGKVPALGDEKGICFRAITYVLLRGGDLEKVLTSDKDGPISVGHNVRAVAASLAALRAGLRGSPSVIKTLQGSDDGLAWMSALGRSVLCDLGLSEVTVSLSATSNEGSPGLWSVGNGDKVLYTLPVPREPSVRRVLDAIERVGWPVDEVRGSTVISRVLVPHGTDLSVRVVPSGPELTAPLSVVITIYPLSSARSGAGRWPSAKAKKLRKDILFRLLELNAGEPTSSPRFGLSEEDNAVVLIDQVNVSDKGRLAAHLARLGESAALYATDLFTG